MSDAQESKYLKVFGKRVAEIRRQRGYTQEQLAEKMDVPPISIAFIEQGRRWPRIVTLQNLARHLSVTISELLKGL